MQRLFFVLFILHVFFSTPALSQYTHKNEQAQHLYATTAAIEQRAFNAPNRISGNKYQLTQYLIRPFKTDYDKLRVIAYWIASHIAYDNYKYHDGRINLKEMKVNYDILKVKAGICTDFANLFTDMAEIANIHHVEVVHGYVLQNVKIIKKYYHQNEVPPNGHAWNKVTINGRSFFVDTTYMGNSHIGTKKNYKSSLRHKLDLQKRSRTTEKSNKNIEKFYFDFSPRQEVKYNQRLHLMNKYVH